MKRTSTRMGAADATLDQTQLVDPASFQWLRALLMEHRVLDITVGELDEEHYVRFGRMWGTPIEFFSGRDRERRFPELIRVTNSPKTPLPLRDGAMHWHQDSSYESPPASVTMLHALEAPDGNETLFADLVAATAALDEDRRRMVRGLLVRHDPSGGHPDLLLPDERRGDSTSTDLAEVRHPLLIRHPDLGRPVLYGLGGTTRGIDGMDDADAIPLLRGLKEHVLSPEFRLTGRATAGHILVWDNLAVMHRATETRYSDVDGERRLLHRISTRSERELEPA